jgi:hypothetical protein
MKPTSPVITGLEPYEIVFGAAQPEFQPLPALRSAGPRFEVMSRWEPTPEERQMIANGADIFVSIWTFGARYPPTLVRVMHKDTSPKLIKEEMALDLELNARLAMNGRTGEKK